MTESYIAGRARATGCALPPARLLTRRDALRVFGGLAAGAAIGTHPEATAAAKPAAPDAEIDVHCHVFNIRDQAAYAFVLDVVLSNDVLKLFLAPLARFVTYTIWLQAPGYLKEKRKLEDILAHPLVARSTPRNSDDIESMFKKGLAGFIDEYTTFGDNPGPLNSPENDRFIEKLFQTFQIGITIDAGIPPQANREKVVASIDPLYNNMRSQLLENQGKLRRTGRRTPRKPLPFDQGPSAAAYVAQFTIYWAGRLSNYRYQLTDELPTFFTDAKAPPRLVTPATLDITNWLEHSEIDTTPLDLEQQAVLMALVARKEYKSPLVHGFIGFDPWRYIDDKKKKRPKTALDVVKAALNDYGFVGVKLYPPMGFRATHNYDRDDSQFLPKLTADHPGLGAELDKALDELFQYCLANDVPIMAHCAASQGTSDANAECADPKYWKEVLDKAPVDGLDYSKLRLNLGHFGGIWNFDDTPQSGTHIVWNAIRRRHDQVRPLSEPVHRHRRFLGHPGSLAGRGQGRKGDHQETGGPDQPLRSAETPRDVRLGLDIPGDRAGIRGLLRADAQSLRSGARAQRPDDVGFSLEERGAFFGARRRLDNADAHAAARVLFGSRTRSRGPRALPCAASLRDLSCRKITRRRRRRARIPARHANASWWSARICAVTAPNGARATCCSRSPACTPHR